ncbi:MAG: glutathione transferase GstA [Gammaproteobacteria bacterium]|nr:glutathione transferase GstA [Gammaproteobacteria bacterium]MDH3506925.1 glutathione transferase GstA [Gammaproteobacteria bacterium]
MKLYTSPGSCSSASHIALLEAGADFELVKLNLKTDRILPDGRHLNDINPKGYVPVLELDDGELLTENVAILQYIADRYPDSELAPPNGTIERTRLHEWLGFINSEIHKGFSNFFNPNLPEEMRRFVTQRLNGRFAYVDSQLKDRDYLLGDKFTVADAYLFIVCSWSPMFDFDLSPYKNVINWQSRISERDTVKEVKATKPPG